MRELISNTEGYRVIAELREVPYPTGLFQLRFITQWEDAKNPHGEQVKFELHLTADQLKTLKEIL